MTTATIDLEKKREIVNINLAKRGVNKAPVMRVGVALDVSGSARPLYNSGAMQNAFDQLLAIALTFDDNGELDTAIFDTAMTRLRTATAKDAGTYVQREVLPKARWGGTNYAPPLQEFIGDWFGAQQPQKTGLGGLFAKKPAPTPGAAPQPAYLLFMTDGDSYDEAETEAVIKGAQGLPIYFQLIGIGRGSRFPFLQKMGDKYPNCGFVAMPEVRMTDEALFGELISDELVEWVKKF